MGYVVLQSIYLSLIHDSSLKQRPYFAGSEKKINKVYEGLCGGERGWSCLVSYWRAFRVEHLCNCLPLHHVYFITYMRCISPLHKPCGLADRTFDSRSKGLGFDSHYLSSVGVPGKLLIPYCLCPAISDGYLVDENCDWVALAAFIFVWRVHCTLPGEMGLLKWCVSYTREGNWLVDYFIDIRP